MFKSIVSASAFTLSFLAVGANAYSLVSVEKIAGVVSGVNTAEQTLAVTTENGETEHFLLGENTKVKLSSGGSYEFNDIQVGSSVVLKQQIKTPTTQELKGSLVSVDKDSRIITLRESESRQLLTVQFSEGATFRGEATSSIDDLKKGQDLVIRHPAI